LAPPSKTKLSLRADSVQQVSRRVTVSTSVLGGASPDTLTLGRKRRLFLPVHSEPGTADLPCDSFHGSRGDEG